MVRRRMTGSIRTSTMFATLAMVLAACGDPNPFPGGLNVGGGMNSTCTERYEGQLLTCVEYSNWPFDCKQYADQLNAQVAGVAGYSTGFRETTKVGQCPPGPLACCELSMYGAKARMLIYSSDENPCYDGPDVGVTYTPCSL